MTQIFPEFLAADAYICTAVLLYVIIGLRKMVS